MFHRPSYFLLNFLLYGLLMGMIYRGGRVLA